MCYEISRKGLIKDILSYLIFRLGNKLTELFKARKELRKAQMVADGAKRELKWKVARKEKTIRRVNRLTQSLVGVEMGIDSYLQKKLQTSVWNCQI